MQFLSIELKNVLGFYNGSGLKKVKIKIDNDYSNITLIRGSNGSGKSTLVNSLDVFAVETIREDKEGYKKIVLLHKKSKYIIEHYYKPTKISHTVKSFIKKKGKNDVDYIELNENGNSGSFIEIIELELGITKDIMRAVKLSNEFSSIVSMTPAERKTFLNSFIDSTKIFNSYYKKINDDYKWLNKVIANTDIKLSKININNTKSELEMVNNSLKEIDKNILQHQICLKNNNTRKEEILPQLDIDKLQKLKELSNNKDFNKALITNFDEISNRLINLSGDINRLDYEKENASFIIQKNNEVYESNTNDINEISDTLMDDIDINELNFEKEELKTKISKYKKYFNDKNISQYSNIGLQYLEETMMTINDYNKQIEYIIESGNINKDHIIKFDVDTNYDNDLNVIKSKINKYGNDIILLQKNVILLNSDIKNDRIILDKKPQNCINNNCPLLKGITNENLNIKLNKLEEISKQLSLIENDRYILERDITSYVSLAELSHVIKKVIQYCSNNTVLKNFDSYSIIENIRIGNNSLSSILDELRSLYDITSLYNDFKESVDSLKDIQKKIDDNKTNINLKNMKQKLIDKNNEIILENKKCLNTIHDVSYKLEKLNNEYSLCKNLYDLKDKVTLYKKEIEIFNNITKLQKELNDIDNENNVVNYKLDKLFKTKETLLKQRDKLTFDKNQYRELVLYRKSIEKTFMPLTALKEALSIKDGIPLVFIDVLLKRIRKNANKLLKAAFGDKLRLDKFKINESTRNIEMPLVGKGDGNKDIRYASSGERAIISLALNLSLAQDLNADGIMIVDELDGPLDFNLRRKFLDIIESQCNIMSQVFVISHNDTFDNYKANLILLKGADDINVKDKNILYKYSS